MFDLWSNTDRPNADRSGNNFMLLDHYWTEESVESSQMEMPLLEAPLDNSLNLIAHEELYGQFQTNKEVETAESLRIFDYTLTGMD